VQSVAAVLPAHFTRRGAASILSSATAAGRRTFSTQQDLCLELNGSPVSVPQASIDLNSTENWDSAYPGYATPNIRAGSNLCVYVTPEKLIVSPNTTVPTGYTAANSRKIGGFHCLPPYFASATNKTPILTALPGLSASHPAYGFLAGDIVPTSIWDLIDLPECSPEGMVKISEGWWVDIYKQSGTGLTTASVWNASCTRSRTWGDTVDDFELVGKDLLTDSLWQKAMRGCPEGVNVAGSVDPVTAGLYLMTNGLPNISDRFVIGGPGEGYEWTDTQAAKTVSVSALSTEPSFAWTALQSKGSIYTQGSDVKLLAGCSWSAGSLCGSRGRVAFYARWVANSAIGARGCARSRRRKA
jgi:hypothetical protein